MVMAFHHQLDQYLRIKIEEIRVKNPRYFSRVLCADDILAFLRDVISPEERERIECRDTEEGNIKAVRRLMDNMVKYNQFGLAFLKSLEAHQHGDVIEELLKGFPIGHLPECEEAEIIRRLCQSYQQPPPTNDDNEIPNQAMADQQRKMRMLQDNHNQSTTPPCIPNSANSVRAVNIQLGQADNNVLRQCSADVENHQSNNSQPVTLREPANNFTGSSNVNGTPHSSPPSDAHESELSFSVGTNSSASGTDASVEHRRVSCTLTEQGLNDGSSTTRPKEVVQSRERVAEDIAESANTDAGISSQTAVQNLQNTMSQCDAGLVTQGIVKERPAENLESPLKPKTVKKLNHMSSKSTNYDTAAPENYACDKGNGNDARANDENVPNFGISVQTAVVACIACICLTLFFLKRRDLT